MPDGSAKVAEVLSYLLPAGNSAVGIDWPPDLFAVAASLLKQSGGYTEILNKWPPSSFATTNAWQVRAEHIRVQWRQRFNSNTNGLPPDVNRWWRTVLRNGNLPVEDISKERSLVEALIGIVAAADQTCHGVGVLAAVKDEFDDYALALLAGPKTLCEKIDPSRAVVLPKMHNPLDGMTFRSLTHNLALWDRPEVKPLWNQLQLTIDRGMNVLVLPWPLVIDPSSLHETTAISGDRMPESFGLFTYDMTREAITIRRVRMLLKQAENIVGHVHALIFPELSLTENEFDRIFRAIGNRVVVAGIGTPAAAGGLGRNEVAVGAGVKFGGAVRQSKHHRWRLDGGQLDQYGIGATFGNRRSWWEAIELGGRQCTFYTVNRWLTFCALICEDLARQDPVAELVRSVGPNLVVALLMDGPQIAERWSARYATVLAEDPRSSVLTVTSAGLVDLARAQYGGGPRSVGLWKDALSNKPRQIVLEGGAQAVVLSLRYEMHQEWTADGRHDDGTTGYLRLSGTHQVYPA